MQRERKKKDLVLTGCTAPKWNNLFRAKKKKKIRGFSSKWILLAFLLKQPSLSINQPTNQPDNLILVTVMTYFLAVCFPFHHWTKTVLSASSEWCWSAVKSPVSAGYFTSTEQQGSMSLSHARGPCCLCGCCSSDALTFAHPRSCHQPSPALYVPLGCLQLS